MSNKSFLSVAIITNGKSPFFYTNFARWSSEFQPGINLFACMPTKNTKLAHSFIIDCDDEAKDSSFNINRKKHLAGLQISSEYILFVHDRFYPSPNFCIELRKKLLRDRPGFCGLNVDNPDDSASLRELRVKKSRIGLSVRDCFDLPGRSVCLATSEEASDRVALNGGSFVLHQDLLKVLSRPIHWFEMEDDIMSLDLVEHEGAWYSDPHLLTSDFRLNFVENTPIKFKSKLRLYSFLCVSIKLVLRVICREKNILSISDSTTSKAIDLISAKKIMLVDPLHRPELGGFFDNALEKFRAKLRLSGGEFNDFRVTRKLLGWEISRAIDDGDIIRSGVSSD